MTKIVNLEDRRNRETYHYKDGDSLRAVAWAIGSEGGQDLDSAIHDVIFNDDQESAERLRGLLKQCLLAYKHLGPDR